MRILIVGYGRIGKKLHKRFPDAEIHDTEEGLQAADLIEVTTFPSDYKEYRVGNGRYDLTILCPKEERDESIVDEQIEQYLAEMEPVSTVIAIVSAFDDKERIRSLREKRVGVMSPIEWFDFINGNAEPAPDPEVTAESIETTIKLLRADREILLESVENARDGLIKAHTVIEDLRSEIATLWEDLRKRDSELAAIRSIHNETIEKNNRGKK